MTTSPVTSTSLPKDSTMDLDNRNRRPPSRWRPIYGATLRIEPPAPADRTESHTFSAVPAWSFAHHSVATSFDGMLFPGRRILPEHSDETVTPIQARPHGKAPKSPSGLSRRALARALDFMDRKIGEEVSLDEIAGAACVSRSHFARLFRISTGDSPMGYLLRLRIERAKALLAGGDQSICAIALTLGFFDQSHFSRTFRRITGVSPSEFARSV